MSDSSVQWDFGTIRKNQRCVCVISFRTYSSLCNALRIICAMCCVYVYFFFIWHLFIFNNKSTILGDTVRLILFPSFRIFLTLLLYINGCFFRFDENERHVRSDCYIPQYLLCSFYIYINIHLNAYSFLSPLVNFYSLNHLRIFFRFRSISFRYSFCFFSCMLKTHSRRLYLGRSSNGNCTTLTFRCVHFVCFLIPHSNPSPHWVSNEQHLNIYSFERPRRENVSFKAVVRKVVISKIPRNYC